MGDYFNTTITIGGKLPKMLVHSLAEVANTGGLGINWDEASISTLEAWLLTWEKRNIASPIFTGKLNWGDADLFEEFCHENSLAYIRSVDALYEYDGEVHWWLPGMEYRKDWEPCSADSNSVYIGVSQLEDRLAKKKTLKQVIEELKGIPPNLPPFKVVSDPPTVV